MAKQNLVLATSAVLTAGALIEYKEKKKGHPGITVKNEAGLGGQLVAITLLSVALSFTVEQAPEFGGPLCLLIIVAGLIRYSKSFGLYFNETQGKTK